VSVSHQSYRRCQAPAVTLSVGGRQNSGGVYSRRWGLSDSGQATGCVSGVGPSEGLGDPAEGTLAGGGGVLGVSEHAGRDGSYAQADGVLGDLSDQLIGSSGDPATIDRPTELIEL